MFENLRKKFSDFIGSVVKKEEKEEKEEEPESAQSTEKEAATHSQPAEQDAADGAAAKTEDAMRTAHDEHAPADKPEETAHGSIPAVGRNNAAVGSKPEETGGILSRQKLSLGTKIKGFVLGAVEIREKDINEVMDGFRISLLQSDVNYDTADRIVDTIRDKLVGKKVALKDMHSEIEGAVRESLLGILRRKDEVRLADRIISAREGRTTPFKILFLGPNGAGKTTSIGKIARLLTNSGISCVMSASDTFRAAAIEQTAIHAERLGIAVIKSGYGADPASVAYDAVAYARARGIDAVLIDSAGRQETNRSLIDEIKKMDRVVKPDMKIFVGESIAGNAILEQVKAFRDAVGIDGIILTKLDCDAKGGNTISILSETDVPVLFFCAGEGYDALIEYRPEIIVNSILPQEKTS
jgi:fused signal recognition particle receptor